MKTTTTNCAFFSLQLFIIYNSQQFVLLHLLCVFCDNNLLHHYDVSQLARRRRFCVVTFVPDKNQLYKSINADRWRRTSAGTFGAGSTRLLLTRRLIPAPIVLALRKGKRRVSLCYSSYFTRDLFFSLFPPFRKLRLVRHPTVSH